MTEGASAQVAPADPNTRVLTFSNSLMVATMPTTQGQFETFELPTPDGPLSIQAYLLGHATSHRPKHKQHRNGSFAAPREKCSACRWFEVRIFRLDPQRHREIFAVHTLGATMIPDEIVKCRLEFAQTGYEVIEVLTVRQSDTVFLPAASSRALSQAAGLDRDIETAYVNRAVS
jgi:hypothetical protein